MPANTVIRQNAKYQFHQNFYLIIYKVLTIEFTKVFISMQLQSFLEYYKVASYLTAKVFVLGILCTVWYIRMATLLKLDILLKLSSRYLMTLLGQYYEHMRGFLIVNVIDILFTQQSSYIPNQGFIYQLYKIYQC